MTNQKFISSDQGLVDVSIFQYLQMTIQQMQEAWEDILLEMDSKLYNFAEQKQVRTVLKLVDTNLF